MSGLRVMIVDDSALIVRSLSSIIKEMGHEVVHACPTGWKAIQDYPIHKPDIVTMDITMPDMDGIEATRRILEFDPEAFIIMVTSHAQKQMVMDAIEVGAKGYVLKPFKMDKLVEAFSRAPRQKKSEPTGLLK